MYKNIYHVTSIISDLVIKAVNIEGYFPDEVLLPDSWYKEFRKDFGTYFTVPVFKEEHDDKIIDPPEFQSITLKIIEVRGTDKIMVRGMGHSTHDDTSV